MTSVTCCAVHPATFHLVNQALNNKKRFKKRENEGWLRYFFYREKNRLFFFLFFEIGTDIDWIARFLRVSNSFVEFFVRTILAPTLLCSGTRGCRYVTVCCVVLMAAANEFFNILFFFFWREQVDGVDQKSLYLICRHAHTRWNVGLNEKITQRRTNVWWPLYQKYVSI